MGKLDAVFKAEISRLAKREIKPLVLPLRRQVRSLTQQVKTLLAESKRLSRSLARWQQVAASQPNVPQLAAAEGENGKSRISPGLIKKLRARLDITQGQLAGLVGVSSAAVQSWEQGIARPGDQNKAALVALRDLGRRELAELLASKGIGKPGRKPRTEVPPKEEPPAKRGKARPAKRWLKRGA